MHFCESAMQSIHWDNWDSQNDLKLEPIWHKYYESIENFLNNNINTSFTNSHQILTDNKNISMDESEDNKNWRKTPFERVNHSTNFEDYACTSDDTKLLFTSDPVINNQKSDKTLTSKQMSETNKEAFSQSINKISNKSPKFESSVTPIISTYLADQRDHSFMESCISAGNSSAEVTPSGTPQNSPYTLRKVIDGNKVKIAKSEKNSSLSVNPKRWFYTGFFLNPDNVQHKPIINDKPTNQITKNLSFKNLSVSNFDINAVGPTSW